MQWTDEGIVLGSKRHGEANAILELMTRAHGRHLGLVRGGAGSRLRPVLQPGNRISSTWRARLDEHLGHYAVEGLDARAASFLPVSHALYGMTHLAALCRLLPERDPHPQIHAALEGVLDALLDPRRAAAGVSARGARSFAAGHRRWLRADRFLPGASRARAARAQLRRRTRELYRRARARRSAAIE